MIVPLSRPYACRHGLPVVDRVDTRVYVWTYFAACMDCTFCFDTCCQYGATVEPATVERIRQRADVLEPYVGYPREQWFHDWFKNNGDYPGGRYTRTRVIDGSCVFLNRHGRGCLLHRFALEQGVAVSDIKPMMCNLFPVLPENGVLGPPDEIVDGSLACLGRGPTLYRSARADLEHYFGAELIAELDVLEAAVVGAPPATLALPVVTGPAPTQVTS
jgi:Fe-S-cluster containining protein